MQHALNVHALADNVAPEELSGGVVVVIDVLRASTTIVHALEAGAAEVIPCLEVEDARAVAAKLPPADVVLGGERQGLPIEGFDLGNSPTQYTDRTVRGRTVVFTTTNGTRAMQKCRQAARVLIGTFVNATAVYEQLRAEETRSIHLLCAGTHGEFSGDDVFMAGLLVQRLRHRGANTYQLNAQALTAREDWTTAFAGPCATGSEALKPELLARQLRQTIAGKNLIAIGRDDDILTASKIDRFRTVPELDTSTFHIRQFP